MPNLIALILIVPLFFAVFSFVFLSKARHIGLIFSIIWLVSVLAIVVTTSNGTIISYQFGGFAPPLGITYQTKGFGVIALALSAIVIFATTLYSFFYLKEKNIFYPVLCFLAAGLAVIFLSQDLFNIYVGLEIIGISAVALTAVGKDTKNITAAINYFFATLLGSGFYLLGVALLYANYGTLHIEQLHTLIFNDLHTNFIFVLFMVGLAIKTALFPFHFWLPPAHSNALTPVSALLSAIVVKASFYLLYLLYTELFYDFAIANILGYLGLIAIIYGAVQAFLAKNLKLLIAYSSVSQLGYLFLVFYLPSNFAKFATVLQLLSHGLAKAGFFLAAGVIIYFTQSKKISAIKGSAHTLPVATFAIALSGVSLIGLPPSLGFGAKWYFLLSAINDGAWLFVVAIASGSLLGAAYIFKLLILSLQTPSTMKTHRIHGFVTLQWIAFVLSFLSVCLGFFTSHITQIGGV